MADVSLTCPLSAAVAKTRQSGDAPHRPAKPASRLLPVPPPPILGKEKNTTEMYERKDAGNPRGREMKPQKTF